MRRFTFSSPIFDATVTHRVTEEPAGGRGVLRVFVCGATNITCIVDRETGRYSTQKLHISYIDQIAVSPIFKYLIEAKWSGSKFRLRNCNPRKGNCFWVFWAAQRL